MKKWLALYLVLFLGACAPGIHQRLPRNRIGKLVKSIILDEQQSLADWGIFARNLRTGKTIVSYNASKLFLPASNTKLYTTAAFLYDKGQDYRFHTPIVIAGKVIDSTLHGDLIVIGMGDPTWSARFYDGDGKTVFRQWADSLRAYGINAIDGRVIGIDGMDNDKILGSGWGWDDQSSYYSAQIAGLTFNENTQDLMIIPQPDWLPPIIEDNPVTSYTTIENNLISIDTTNNPDSIEVDWGYERELGTNHITLSGIFIADTVETGASIHNPLLFTATVLKETLVEQGINVSGDVDGFKLFAGDSLNTIPAGDTLFVFQSLPLHIIIHELNKASQNLMAEMLLRGLGYTPESGGSAKSGLAKARIIWASMGVDTNSTYLVDGSGLSRYNKLTPLNTANLLTYMFPDTAFFNSLPIAGVDGTLETTMTNSLATGRVHAKTGTLRGARALSGYLQNNKGDWIVFSFMVNDYLTSVREVNWKIRQLCVALIRHS